MQISHNSAIDSTAPVRSDCRPPGRDARGAACAVLLLLCAGCYAPLRSPAIPASALPDTFRMPYRTAGPVLNYSQLTLPQPADYLLGPGDLLLVRIPQLEEHGQSTEIQVTVMANGTIQMPLVGSIEVGDRNLQQAQDAINRTYAAGFLVDPRISVTLMQKAMIGVLVLGQVNAPGVHYLPRFENDVGHAIAAAGGLAEEAAEVIEIHRKASSAWSPVGPAQQPTPTASIGWHAQTVAYSQPARSAGQYHDHRVTAPHSHYAARHRMPAAGPTRLGPTPTEPVFHPWVPAIVRLPLRGRRTWSITENDITLHAGDVVVVPNRKHEVFYVVGRLSQTNTVRFTVGDRERELGVGFVLPRDRELDVVTAVAMAGYIDPIDSPTTATVHRTGPRGQPMLIRVDLIAARYDRRETVLVNPGDIIYLNPDSHWWFRRTLDRIIPRLFQSSYDQLLGR